jgi:hypothetical protein
MDRMLNRVLFLTALATFVAGTLSAAAGPQDFDFKLVSKKSLRQAEEFTVDSAIAVRASGVQGWSYGVKHDAAYLDVLSATTVGSDVPAVFKGGFDQTILVQEGAVNVGWIQAIVLSFQEKRELPITPQFIMAKSQYKVRTGICETESEIRTSIAYSDKLSVAGSPPVELNVTVEGTSLVPGVTEAADLTISCPAPGELELWLTAQNVESRKLTANKTDVLPINLSLEDRSDEPADVQGWSYGLKLDPAVLEVVELTSSPGVTALDPDFRSYDCPNCPPDVQDGKNGAKGITVGVVISLSETLNPLVIPASGAKVLEVLKVKSAIQLALGAADVTTPIEFVNEVIPSDLPIENIIVVNGQSLTPKNDSPSLVITLTAPTLEKPFRRSDFNSDGRADIADGICLIMVMFPAQGSNPNCAGDCQKAGDANDDGRIDLSDAVYIFNYFLQPGKHSGDSLYPKPPAPYPGCGTDPTPDDLSCEQPTANC